MEFTAPKLHNPVFLDVNFKICNNINIFCTIFNTVVETGTARFKILMQGCSAFFQKSAVWTFKMCSTVEVVI